MTLNLDEIEARANAATQGPWVLGYWSGRCNKDHAHNRDVCSYEMVINISERCIAAPENIELIGSDDHGPILNKQNAVFISHARTDIPNLIQAVRELAEALKEVDGPYEIEWADKSRLRDFINNQKGIAKSVLLKWGLK